MKNSVFTSVIPGLILLFIVAVPVAAATISSISPSVGYSDGKTRAYTITGTNFSSTAGDIWLEKSGEDDIDAYSVTSWSSTEIVCRFRFPSATATGTWDIVVKGSDNVETRSNRVFTISSAMTLTSISPTHAQVNNDNVDFTIAGTGLKNVEDVFLYNSDYDNITAVDVVVMSSTKVEGTFDLTDTEVDTYDVCVVDDFGTEECDLSFEITTDEVGSIDISSSPSGASIYIDGSLEGTTPDTVEDLEEGSYNIVLKKSGYSEWGKVVKVRAGETSTVNAYLERTATVSTTVTTTRPTTARTTKVSTIKIPTTWPSATPTTAASPVDPVLVLGAAGIALGLVVIRRR
jgi:hypothetical protein